jgi:hypothetical protein
MKIVYHNTYASHCILAAIPAYVQPDVGYERRKEREKRPWDTDFGG